MSERPAKRVLFLLNARVAYRKAIVKYLRDAEHPVGASEIRDVVGGTYPQLRANLLALIEEGKIARIGNTRNTCYWLAARAQKSDEGAKETVVSPESTPAKVSDERLVKKVISDAVTFIINLPKIRAHNGRQWRADPIGCARMIASVLSTPDPRVTLQTIAERTGCRRQSLTCLLNGRSTNNDEWPAFRAELERLTRAETDRFTPESVVTAPTNVSGGATTYEVDPKTGDILIVTRTRVVYGSSDHVRCLAHLSRMSPIRD